MKIVAILSQNRRDFTAMYKCQFCDYREEDTGYDDDYFHNSVVPDMKCVECGKSTNSEGGEHVRIVPKYPENLLL